MKESGIKKSIVKWMMEKSGIKKSIVKWMMENWSCNGDLW